MMHAGHVGGSSCKPKYFKMSGSECKCVCVCVCVSEDIHEPVSRLRDEAAAGAGLRVGVRPAEDKQKGQDSAENCPRWHEEDLKP